jgi:methylated-DNA-protein-cysteine methyltransferase-like protein
MASSRRRRSRKPDPEEDELTAHVRGLYKEIYKVVRRIPRGKVATYGQVAEMAGLPGGARVAGAAMRASKGLPWQRVLGKRGKNRAGVAILDPVGAAVQRGLLEKEGVVVTDRGLIDLRRFGWAPQR